MKRHKKIFIYLGVFAAFLIVSTVSAEFLKNNYMQAYKIPSGSNEPTLLIGDFIVVDRTSSAKIPKRGDMVVFKFPQDPKLDYVKRVVALGGDIVEMRNKILFVNNEPIAEPYVVHNDPKVIASDRSFRDNFGPINVPEGSYFVLGDNRDNSYDSRFWGFVEKSKMKGTVKTIYWSWDRQNYAIRWDRIGQAVQ